MNLDLLYASKSRAIANSLAQKYLGRFPDHVKAYMDFDDLEAMGILQAHAKHDRFDASRAALSTFLHTVIESYYIDLLRRSARPKHRSIPVDFELLQNSSVIARDAVYRCPFLLKRVNAFFALASDDLQDFLLQLLYGEPSGKLDRRTFQKFLQEAKKLRSLTGVSVEDFRVLGLV